METKPKWAIRPITPEEVYTDRSEHLEFLYQYAIKAITRRAMSTVLLGQRRMGKTEIFKRVVNRLFFEQEAYTNPHTSVVPVYFSFEDKETDPYQFAERYTENFLRWFVAFRSRNPDILLDKALDRNELVDIIKSNSSLSQELKGALNLFEALPGRNVIAPESKALWMPRRVSDRNESTIVMFLDEFQYTRLPQYRFDIVGLMQEAVESPTCPHFVTGSAMSILASEILGRGSLFGRFHSEPIGPLTEYWGAELARKAADFYDADVSEDMTPVLAARCGGNPFYISAVIQQAAIQQKSLSNEEQINEILAVDLSSGFIWGELNDQVNRWIHRINEQGITKWILYLSALEQGDMIDPDRIQKELWERDRKEVSIEDIRHVLIHLSRGDLLEYNELGGWFRKIDDPILLEFLKVWGQIAVEGRRSDRVQKEIVRQYQTLQKRIYNHLGYLGEIYMAQVLWNSQNQTLPGHYFHSAQDIPIPWHFNYISHRTRLGGGSDMELDVEAAAGKEMWICESKWWKDKKVGVEEVNSLLYKADLLKKKEGPGLEILRLWFFAHNGFTKEAEELMKQKGILWSTQEDLNALLSYVGLKQLPNI